MTTKQLLAAPFLFIGRAFLALLFTLMFAGLAIGFVRFVTGLFGTPWNLPAWLLGPAMVLLWLLILSGMYQEAKEKQQAKETQTGEADAGTEQTRQGESSSKDLPHICYEMAYFMLPQMLFTDAQRTIADFSGHGPTSGGYLYFIFCKAHGIEPVPEHARAFHVHVGELSEGWTYHVLEYPTPKPGTVNLLDKDSVLAPYFSAILHRQATGEMDYYTLGQRPMVGGTTLRTVTREGVNANLGEGPAPELNAFLDALRQRG